MWIRSLGWEDPLEEDMATHSSILAGKIPWTQEPGGPQALVKDMNPNSLEVLTGCKVEASLRDAKAPASYQFMRLGYFCPDSRDCAPGHLVFNRSVSLKDSFKPGK